MIVLGKSKDDLMRFSGLFETKNFNLKWPYSLKNRVAFYHYLSKGEKTDSQNLRDDRFGYKMKASLDQ